MIEEWRNVLGYEGLYQVSNLGRVRSLSRFVGGGFCGEYKLICGKILKSFDNRNGYRQVTLHKDGERKNYYVHRLVATAFLPCPDECCVINHKDYNRSNNAADNLEWCTQAENVNYSAVRMRKPKKSCKATNTGEKYIRMCTYPSGKKAFRVTYRQKGVDKSFSSLDLAVAYRNGVV